MQNDGTIRCRAYLWPLGDKKGWVVVCRDNPDSTTLCNFEVQATDTPAKIEEMKAWAANNGGTDIQELVNGYKADSKPKPGVTSDAVTRMSDLQWADVAVIGISFDLGANDRAKLVRS